MIKQPVPMHLFLFILAFMPYSFCSGLSRILFYDKKTQEYQDCGAKKDFRQNPSLLLELIRKVISS